jgi:hypothetical protein
MLSGRNRWHQISEKDAGEERERGHLAPLFFAMLYPLNENFETYPKEPQNQSDQPPAYS